MKANATRRIAVVELKGQRHVHELHLDEGRSVVIGRDWDSDIVVSDEFVDASHLALRQGEAGELLVEDLGTGNGTRIGKRPLQRETVCTDGTRLSLGETVITLHEAGAGVAPATRFDAVNVLARTFQSPLWAIPAAAIAAAALYGELYLLGSAELKGDTLLETLAGFAAMAFIWCMVGGIVGKVLRHRAHLGLHWIVFCLIFAGAFPVSALAGLLAFNLDSGALDLLLEPVMMVAFTFVLGYAFLTLSTRLRRSWRVASGLLVGAVPIVFSLVVPALQDAHERWSPVAISESVRQPAGMLFIAPIAVADHFEKADGLFAVLESELERVAPVPGAPEDAVREKDRILSSGVE